MEIGINLKDYFYVKLTDKGVKILEQLNKDFFEKYPDKKDDPSKKNIFLPQYDEDGYCVYQFKDLMSLFGRYIYFCYTLPFEKVLLVNVNVKIEISLKDYFYVKLTDKGVEVLKGLNKNFCEKYPRCKEDPISKNLFLPKYNERGYCAYDLGELLSFFGEHIDSCDDLPFEEPVRHNILREVAIL